MLPRLPGLECAAITVSIISSVYISRCVLVPAFFSSVFKWTAIRTRLRLLATQTHTTTELECKNHTGEGEIHSPSVFSRTISISRSTSSDSRSVTSSTTRPVVDLMGW